VRVPEDALETLTALATKRGISKHQWIREAIAEKIERDLLAAEPHQDEDPEE